MWCAKRSVELQKCHTSIKSEALDSLFYEFVPSMLYLVSLSCSRKVPSSYPLTARRTKPTVCHQSAFHLIVPASLRLSSSLSHPSHTAWGALTSPVHSLALSRAPGMQLPSFKVQLPSNLLREALSLNLGSFRAFLCLSWHCHFWKVECPSVEFLW